MCVIQDRGASFYWAISCDILGQVVRARSGRGGGAQCVATWCSGTLEVIRGYAVGGILLRVRQGVVHHPLRLSKSNICTHIPLS